MPTPTLEELLALKEKMSSLPSFQKDTEEDIVSDALAAPVRPEYTEAKQKALKERENYIEDLNKKRLVPFSDEKDTLAKERMLKEYDRFNDPENIALKTIRTIDEQREKRQEEKSQLAELIQNEQKKLQSTTNPFDVARINSRLSGYQNKFTSLGDQSSSVAPFYPTPDGAPVEEKQLDITPTVAAAPKRALASVQPAEKQAEDAQLQKILQQPSEYEDLLARFRDAQERQRVAQLGVGLTQAAERIGSAIAMTKPGDQSVYEQAMKQAGGITEQFKEEETMAREAKRQDPKSPESEAARQLLKEQGITVPDTVSAAFIEKQYPQFTAIINRKELAKQEAIRRQERAQDRQDRLMERLEGKNRELALRLAPKIQNKKYDTYTELAAQKALVDEAVRNPNPQRDITVFYSFVKALDPESVVREGELKFVQTSRSIPEGLRQTLKNALTGEKLSKEERLRIQDFMNQRLQLSQKQWQDSAAPFLKQTSEAGIDQELVAPGTTAIGSQAQEKKSTITLPEKSAARLKVGQSFTVQSTGKTYKVNADGKTATEL
jgi:hypothetical protein